MLYCCIDNPAQHVLSQPWPQASASMSCCSRSCLAIITSSHIEQIITACLGCPGKPACAYICHQGPIEHYNTVQGAHEMLHHPLYPCFLSVGVSRSTALQPGGCRAVSAPLQSRLCARTIQLTQPLHISYMVCSHARCSYLLEATFVLYTHAWVAQSQRFSNE